MHYQDTILDKTYFEAIEVCNKSGLSITGFYMNGDLFVIEFDGIKWSDPKKIKVIHTLTK